MTTFDDYRLGDRYTHDEGTVFMTGIQALVRLPIEQLRADRANGLSTAAFLSGYPGSPVGGFDQEMARAARQVPDLPIVIRPGVNEELGATAVMGSQLATEQPGARYDGVLGIWYGKAPGLDRAGDALRHAVFAGTSRHGGAIAIVGDDPAAKSSTLPSSSDATLVDLHMPILYPGDVQEALDLGRHAVAMSRATGLWAGMKIVAAVADGSGTVDLAPSRIQPVVPDLTIDGQPYVHRPNGQLITPFTLELEREFREIRTELLRRYARANHLNRVTVATPKAWLGLISTGYTYHEMREALRRLGLDTDDKIEAAGIRIMQMMMPVPFEPSRVREFVRGLEEVVVVEEKNPTLEWLVKDALYGGPDQPIVVGKTHEDGRTLMRNYDILDADAMISGLRERIERRSGAHLVAPPPPARQRTLLPLTVQRSPYFCSGCPHNHGTKVPDDSLVGAGIGCHGMVMFMPEEKVGNVAGITSMGGEGVQFIGMDPFIERDHYFQNLGDGTFFHSGQLAVQASIAAGINITYKILYNGTVAMTGGQDAQGQVGIAALCRILEGHGVAKIVITTDDLGDYKGVALPEGVTVRSRNEIVAVQEELRQVKGVTVLINEQVCAAQARRLRKRQQLPTPPFRTVINHRICEGCGDCGVKSNCLSVQPLETVLGTKTTIDQTSCNLDFSCLEGDCPSFMTIATTTSASHAAVSVAGTETLPDPVFDVALPLGVRLAGIGGTGVVTVAQILGTALLFDGYSVRGLDQTGLSQKAGPVVSDLRISRDGTVTSNLLGEGGADVVIAFDLLVGADDKTLDAANTDATIVIGNTARTPTGSMVGHPDVAYPSDAELIDRIGRRSRAEANRYVDASAATMQLFGSSTGTNIYLLGVAVQLGHVPVSPDSVCRAIGLNGVAVDANIAAFNAGRRWGAFGDLTPSADSDGVQGISVRPLPAHLGAIIDGYGFAERADGVVRLLAADLVDYQNDAYAQRFCTTVAEMWSAERRAGGDGSLVVEVARSLHKLMAYKDEYEVARLLLSPEADAAARSIGGEKAVVHWKLHPPMLRALGVKQKLSISASKGRIPMKLLAKGKRLRGTAADPFGRNEVRRLERELLARFESELSVMGSRLADGSMAMGEVAELVRAAQSVRGYEDLKLESGRGFLQLLDEKLR